MQRLLVRFGEIDILADDAVVEGVVRDVVFDGRLERLEIGRASCRERVF